MDRQRAQVTHLVAFSSACFLCFRSLFNCASSDCFCLRSSPNLLSVCCKFCRSVCLAFVISRILLEIHRNNNDYIMAEAALWFNGSPCRKKNPTFSPAHRSPSVWPANMISPPSAVRTSAANRFHFALIDWFRFGIFYFQFRICDTNRSVAAAMAAVESVSLDYVVLHQKWFIEYYCFFFFSNSKT